MTNHETILAHAKRITAQVAAEAIIDAPDAYDHDVIDAVRHEAEAAGVSSFYLDMLPTTDK